jgi:hypothetical protein
MAAICRRTQGRSLTYPLLQPSRLLKRFDTPSAFATQSIWEFDLFVDLFILKYIKLPTRLGVPLNKGGSSREKPCQHRLPGLDVEVY